MRFLTIALATISMAILGTQSIFAQPPAQGQRDRAGQPDVQWYNGRWWYQSDAGAWMYWDGDEWRDFAPRQYFRDDRYGRSPWRDGYYGDRGYYGGRGYYDYGYGDRPWGYGRYRTGYRGGYYGPGYGGYYGSGWGGYGTQYGYGPYGTGRYSRGEAVGGSLGYELGGRAFGTRSGAELGGALGAGIGRDR